MVLRCDYAALADAIVEYLSGLIRAGITPMVIMDGMQDREKEATTLLRRHAQVSLLVIAYTSQGRTLPVIDNKRRVTKPAVAFSGPGI